MDIFARGETLRRDILGNSAYGSKQDFRTSTKLGQTGLEAEKETYGLIMGGLETSLNKQIRSLRKSGWRLTPMSRR